MSKLIMKRTLVFIGAMFLTLLAAYFSSILVLVILLLFILLMPVYLKYPLTLLSFPFLFALSILFYLFAPFTLGLNIGIVVGAFVLILNLFQIIYYRKWQNKWSWIFLLPIAALTFDISFYSSSVLVISMPLLLLLLFMYAYWSTVKIDFKSAMKSLFDYSFRTYYFDELLSFFKIKKQDKSIKSNKKNNDKSVLNYIFITFVVLFSIFSLFNIESYIAGREVNNFIEGKSNTVNVEYLSRLSRGINDEMIILRDLYEGVDGEGNACGDKLDVEFLTLMEKEENLRKVYEGDHLNDTSYQVLQESISAFAIEAEKVEDFGILTLLDVYGYLNDNSPLPSDLQGAWRNVYSAEKQYSDSTENMRLEIEAIAIEIKEMQEYKDSLVLDAREEEICTWGPFLDKWYWRHYKYFIRLTDASENIGFVRYQVNRKNIWFQLPISDWKILDDYIISDGN